MLGTTDGQLWRLGSGYRRGLRLDGGSGRWSDHCNGCRDVFVGSAPGRPSESDGSGGDAARGLYAAKAEETRAMAPRRVLVVGGGFAGLWAAAAAARALDLLGGRDVEVVLLSPDPFHVVRVRCYEAELAPVRVPLDEVLGPIGVRRVEGIATDIDWRRRTVAVRPAAWRRRGRTPLRPARARRGKRAVRPPIPGLAEHAFDVDTYGGAARLARHLAGSAVVPPAPEAGALDRGGGRGRPGRPRDRLRAARATARSAARRRGGPGGRAGPRCSCSTAVPSAALAWARRRARHPGGARRRGRRSARRRRRARRGR